MKEDLRKFYDNSIEKQDQNGQREINKGKIPRIVETFYKGLYQPERDSDTKTKENLQRIITNVNSEEPPDIQNIWNKSIVNTDEKSQSPDEILTEMWMEEKSVVVETIKQFW